MFNKTTYDFLNCTNRQIPGFYELPKIHKPGTLLRPITAFYSNPIYEVSKYVANVLYIFSIKGR